MKIDTLERFRKGLAAGEFTLTQVQVEADIPLATLSDMKDAEWRPKIFDRLEKLETAIDALTGKRSKRKVRS